MALHRAEHELDDIKGDEHEARDAEHAYEALEVLRGVEFLSESEPERCEDQEVGQPTEGCARGLAVQCESA